MNKNLFLSLGRACILLAAWRTDQDTERPHSRNGWQTPVVFAQTFTPQRA